MDQKKSFLAITEEEERVGKAVVNAAYIVHKELGPGLLERVYEVCFAMFYLEMDFSFRDK